MNENETDARLARDEINFQLNQAGQFYNRDVSILDEQIWSEALQGRPLWAIRKAFKDHYKTGKYYPRPADVLALMGSTKANPPPRDNTTKAAPEIGAAWVIFFRRVHGWTPPNSRPEVKMTWDEALEIVNREAARFDMPEAIPDAYKIQNYWFKSY